MLDFLMVVKKTYPRKAVIDIYPKFRVQIPSSDLMVRGGDFYAVYDEEEGLWTKNEQYVIDRVDEELSREKQILENHVDGVGKEIKVSYMWDSDSGSIDKWHKFVQKQMRDSYHQLDEKVAFSNSKTKKEDYVSKKLSYPLEKGEFKAYDELMSTLYDPEERTKLEWAVGSIIAGDSRKIQKFIVLYGSAGSGKSTFLNILQKLFPGYYTVFDAKSLGSSNNSFALESFKDNPLIAIQHDGDLSRIEDNTKLNSIVSHEIMEINEKHKNKYPARLNAFLFMGTNKPVKITEAKSGLIRRLIDVHPSGRKVPFSRYNVLMSQIEFELTGIAYHCLKRYKKLGPTYYDNYVPVDMMSATNDFYDFIDTYYDDFLKVPYIILRDAWGLYKKYCDYANVLYPLNMRQVRVELKNYFAKFHDQLLIDGKHLRNVYSGFLAHKFDSIVPDENVAVDFECWIELGNLSSVFDEIFKDCPAQMSSESGHPKQKWENVTTVLSDVDTKEEHWVKPPDNLIVIDFDIKRDGKKSLEDNLKAAASWPKTYAEVSKSGEGLHLHYFYDGDVSRLSRIYDENIEIKVFTGNSSLRRRLSLCNSLAVSTISSGLPLKEESKMLDFDGLKSEKMIRSFIKNCLAKKHHGATKPEMDFMQKVLADAYLKKVEYDITDMKAEIMAFAAKSSNQALVCMKIARNLPYVSRNEEKIDIEAPGNILFFDVEVFPNLFILSFKPIGEDIEPTNLINPSSLTLEQLCQYKLVGFNNRRYDNHILYGRMVEKFDNYQLFRLSQSIVENKPNATFKGAYNLSYADVYDFSPIKQSLKKFEIELGIHHQELGLPWDEPVSEDLWETVAQYCANDVKATEAVWNHLQGAFRARGILSNLADMTVNSTTNSLTTKIILGSDRNPPLVYTDLATGERFQGTQKIGKDPVCFPGYQFDAGKNIYRGEDVGRGGYVYSEPGMYRNVALLDVASMHPTSIEQLNLFGPYTKRFSELKRARLLIKHREFDEAKKMLDGKLAPYLEDESVADDLSYALKIAINSVYGLTAASFSNPFKDPKNINNIVALRGALFMVDLKHAVQEKGYTVAHIKTDSIKIPNATKEIIDFVMEFGKKYGYEFEHEATYDRMCLVNNAVYIAKYDNDGKWTATGTQFAVPYVFKTLFSKEPIEFKDMCETKSVTSAMYLNMNEGLEDGESDLKFIGRVGLLCPIKPGKGGGELLRKNGDKYDAVVGTKGYRWLEAEAVEALQKQDDIDRSYYIALVDAAKDSISEYGDFEEFVS